MDLKRFEKLRDERDRLRDEARALDTVLILDTEIVNIFKANNITLKDISRLLNIKSFPDYSTMFSYWDAGGELSADNNSLDAVLKILSMSKNDLAYIISKTRILRKMFNAGETCYFVNLLSKLENTKETFKKDKIVKSNNTDTTIETLSNELVSKFDKAMLTLGQVLNMVNGNIEFSIKDIDMLFNNNQEKIKELFSFASGDSICIDDSRAVMVNDSGVLVVYSNNALQSVVAGNSEIAIKLYEDLLVGYNKNKKAAVYYSSLFTKYIIS